MKKLGMIVLSLSMVFLLFGCAMEDVDPQEFSLYHDLTYDFDSLTFTNTLTADILYKTGNPLDDLKILYHQHPEIDLTIDEWIAYEALFDKLILVSQSSSITLGVMMGYSSEQLRVLLHGYSIELTISDIIIFNQLKITLSEIKASDDTMIMISKIDYIEKRRNASLSENELFSLDTLQDHYLEFREMNPSYILMEHSFEEFIAEIETLGWVITVEDRERLLQAFEILEDLKE